MNNTFQPGAGHKIVQIQAVEECTGGDTTVRLLGLDAIGNVWIASSYPVRWEMYIRHDELRRK